MKRINPKYANLSGLRRFERLTADVETLVHSLNASLEWQLKTKSSDRDFFLGQWAHTRFFPTAK